MQFGYLILYVPDIDLAIDFYQRAFGANCRFRHQEGDHGYAELATGTTVLALASEALATSHGFTFRPTRPDGDPPAVEIAWVTRDVAAAFDRAVAAGAVAVSQPTQKPWGQTVSYVRDLNGFLVEICSPMGGPSADVAGD